MDKNFYNLHKKQLFVVAGIVLILFFLFLLVKRFSKTPSSTPQNKNSFMYSNPELGFSFNYQKTSVISGEEKSSSASSKRYLSLTLKDPTLIKKNLKDDEQYLVLEVWRPDAPYILQTCEPQKEDKKVKSIIQVGNISATQLIYSDSFSRFHWDTCILHQDKMILLKASASTKYGNTNLVSSYLKTITASLTLQ